MNFWNDFEMISNNSLRVDIALVIVVLPGLWSAVGAQKCELLNWCVLKKKLPNFSVDEESRAGKWWEKKLCLIFTKFYLQHYWLRNSLFSAAGWPLAISHAHVCDIHIQSQSTRLIFLLTAKILVGCQISMTDAFIWNHPKNEKVILQVIALLIQINSEKQREIW